MIALSTNQYLETQGATSDTEESDIITLPSSEPQILYFDLANCDDFYPLRDNKAFDFWKNEGEDLYG